MTKYLKILALFPTLSKCVRPLAFVIVDGQLYGLAHDANANSFFSLNKVLFLMLCFFYLKVLNLFNYVQNRNCDSLLCVVVNVERQ